MGWRRGDVMYTVAGMTDKNKDVLLKDLLDLVGSSSNQFLNNLFPDRIDPDSKKRPPTASDKIKVRPFLLFFLLKDKWLIEARTAVIGERSRREAHALPTFLHPHHQAEREQESDRVRLQGYLASDQVSRSAGEYPRAASRVRVQEHF